MLNKEQKLIRLLDRKTSLRYLRRWKYTANTMTNMQQYFIIPLQYM